MILRRKRKSSMIPLSAMGDIAFLLLVFYMATTMVTDQKPREVDLPEVKSEVVGSPYPLIVYLDQELAEKNSVYFFNTTIPLPSLPGELMARASEAPDAVRFYLNIEKDVPYQIMDSVINAFKEAGIRNLIITTRPPREGNSP